MAQLQQRSRMAQGIFIRQGGRPWGPARNKEKNEKLFTRTLATLMRSGFFSPSAVNVHCVMRGWGLSKNQHGVQLERK